MAAGIAGAQPALAQQAQDWDQARARTLQDHDIGVHQSIDRWRQLIANPNMGFAAYSSFLLTYPGYPQENKLRGYAEDALIAEQTPPDQVIAYFDRYPPISNEAAGRYATALASVRRFDAREKALTAWRGGSLAPNAEATLRLLYQDVFTQADQDARMDALLWQGESAQAER